jgi:hypothetical protein
MFPETSVQCIFLAYCHPSIIIILVMMGRIHSLLHRVCLNIRSAQ